MVIVASCGYGGIGRRAWFRSMFSQGRGGSSPLIRTKRSAKPREDYGREGCSHQHERGWLRRFLELIRKRQEAGLVDPCAAGERNHLGYIDVGGMTREG